MNKKEAAAFGHIAKTIDEIRKSGIDIEYVLDENEQLVVWVN